MADIGLLVLGLTLCLALSVVLLPIAKKIRIPYTVLLALFGVLIGLVTPLFTDRLQIGFISDFFISLNNFQLSSEAILFIFLPVLIFESSLTIDVRRLLDDIAPILLLAVVGLLISTFAVGYALWTVSGMGLVLCLLLGAIVSATDPVAVVAIFKELGAPKRLAILVEGESLFNDATAIVLFGILAAMLGGQADAGLVAGALSFLKVFIGGIVVGYILARSVCFLIAKIGNFPLVEITLTICLAYLSFVIAEHYFHVSGVMAVVTAALVLGSTGRTALSSDAWHGLSETWEQLGFWANSLIFVFVGLLVPSLLANFGLWELQLLALLVLVAFAARVAIIFGLLELLRFGGIAERVSTAYKTVMWWGGLRGAVSLALTLAVLENALFQDQDKQFVGLLVTAFVLFTLFINATTIRALLAKLGLDNLSAADLVIRDRALALSNARINAALESAATSQNITIDAGNRYELTNTADDMTAAEVGDIDQDSWIKIGLAALVNQERKAYLSYLQNGYVTSSIARQLLRQAEDLYDAARNTGANGYMETVDKQAGFDWRFHLAIALQRKLGWTQPLANAIVKRFEIIMAESAVLKELREQELGFIEEVVGPSVTNDLSKILDWRIEETEFCLEALQSQYPAYAAALEKCHIGRIAIRLAHSDYHSMMTHSVISPDVYRHLEEGLTAQERELAALPALDLGLLPKQLLVKLPFFEDCSSKSIDEIANQLKPLLALPGEAIVTKGEAGDAVYFIANGAVQLSVAGKHVTLGSGDFFGEIALLDDSPRTATVKASGFCDLLVLYTKDFNSILERFPDLKANVVSAAARRKSENEATDRSKN